MVFDFDVDDEKVYLCKNKEINKYFIHIHKNKAKNKGFVLL